MKGRRPKPTAIKKLQGNPGKRKFNELEPKPKRGCINRYPEWMNEKESSVWEYYTKVLEPMGILTEADYFTLMNMCSITAQIIELKKGVDAEGPTFTSMKMDSMGNEIREMKSNPKVTQLHRLYSEYRYYSGLFGFDPSSRVRLKTSQGSGSKDPLEDFLDGKN